MTIRRYFLLLAAAAVLFVMFPGIDIAVSRWFYEPGRGFPLSRAWPFLDLHEAVPELLIGIAAIIGALAAYNLIRGSNVGGIRLRAVLYLLAAMALGPGLLVNVILKDNWGRARPYQVSELGGERVFTPAFVISDQCPRNCSFVAGDASAGFVLIALALLLPQPWRRIATVAAIGMGAALGLNRVVMGGHFLSDVVFCGLLVGGLMWLLHLLMMVPGGPRRAWQAVAGSDDGTSGCWPAVRRFLAARLRTMPGRLQLAAVVVGIAAALSMLLLDRWVANWAGSLGPGVNALFRTTSDLGVSTGYLVASALIFLACRIGARLSLSFDGEARWRSWSYAAGFAFAAVAASGIATNIVKALLGRFRPKLYFRDQLYGFDFFHWKSDYLAFPSGHTTTAFAVATVLTILWPRHVAAYFLLALLVAASRVLSNAHWVSDVLGGGFVGIAVTLYVRHVFLVNGVAMRTALAGAARWQAPASRLEALALQDVGPTLSRWRRACLGFLRWLPLGLKQRNSPTHGRNQA